MARRGKREGKEEGKWNKIIERDETRKEKKVERYQKEVWEEYDEDWMSEEQRKMKTQEYQQRN